MEGFYSMTAVCLWLLLWLLERVVIIHQAAATHKPDPCVCVRSWVRAHFTGKTFFHIRDCLYFFKLSVELRNWSLTCFFNISARKKEKSLFDTFSKIQLFILVSKYFWIIYWLIFFKYSSGNRLSLCVFLFIFLIFLYMFC